MKEVDEFLAHELDFLVPDTLGPVLREKKASCRTYVMGENGEIELFEAKQMIGTANTTAKEWGIDSKRLLLIGGDGLQWIAIERDSARVMRIECEGTVRETQLAKNWDEFQRLFPRKEVPSSNGEMKQEEEGKKTPKEKKRKGQEDDLINKKEAKRRERNKSRRQRKKALSAPPQKDVKRIRRADEVPPPVDATTAVVQPSPWASFPGGNIQEENSVGIGRGCDQSCSNGMVISSPDSEQESRVESCGMVPPDQLLSFPLSEWSKISPALIPSQDNAFLSRSNTRQFLIAHQKEIVLNESASSFTLVVSGRKDTLFESRGTCVARSHVVINTRLNELVAVASLQGCFSIAESGEGVQSFPFLTVDLVPSSPQEGDHPSVRIRFCFGWCLARLLTKIAYDSFGIQSEAAFVDGFSLSPFPSLFPFLRNVQSLVGRRFFWKPLTEADIGFLESTENVLSLRFLFHLFGPSAIHSSVRRGTSDALNWCRIVFIELIFSLRLICSKMEMSLTDRARRVDALDRIKFVLKAASVVLEYNESFRNRIPHPALLALEGNLENPPEFLSVLKNGILQSLESHAADSFSTREPLFPDFSRFQESVFQRLSKMFLEFKKNPGKRGVGESEEIERLLSLRCNDLSQMDENGKDLVDLAFEANDLQSLKVLVEEKQTLESNGGVFTRPRIGLAVKQPRLPVLIDKPCSSPGESELPARRKTE